MSTPKPMSQREFKRKLEDDAAAAMFAWLRAAGRKIEDIDWPDRKREGRPDQPDKQRTIDLSFREDGRHVCVEIIELHESENHARQHAEMSKIAGQLQRELGSQVKSLTPHTIAIAWDLCWLPDTKTMRSGLEVVKTTILAAAPKLRPDDVVELQPRPDFVAGMEAHCYASPTPSFGFFTMHEEQTGLVMQAAQSMADFLLASRKAAQLKDCGDARVLAIDRALMRPFDELPAAFASRQDRIPANWSAIYFACPAVDGFAEVWRRP